MDGCFVARHIHSCCVTPQLGQVPVLGRSDVDPAWLGSPHKAEAACAFHIPHRVWPHATQPHMAPQTQPHTLPCMPPCTGALCPTACPVSPAPPAGLAPRRRTKTHRKTWRATETHEISTASSPGLGTTPERGIPSAARSPRRSTAQRLQQGVKPLPRETPVTHPQLYRAFMVPNVIVSTISLPHLTLPA